MEEGYEVPYIPALRCVSWRSPSLLPPKNHHEFDPHQLIVGNDEVFLWYLPLKAGLTTALNARAMYMGEGMHQLGQEKRAWCMEGHQKCVDLRSLQCFPQRGSKGYPPTPFGLISFNVDIYVP